jgi:hypothetical protein
VYGRNQTIEKETILMKRKTFDMIMTGGGAALLVLLVVAGALLVWAGSFANNQVHNQLARQNIYFSSAKMMNTPKSETYPQRAVIERYAGEQVLTGAQANAYAYKVQHDVIGLPDHGVYATLSKAALEHPTTAKLKALVTVAFRGTTLQGLLLEAYAFSIFGEIANIAAVAAFILAGVMLILTILGILHIRRTPDDAEFPRPRTPASVSA